MRFIERIIEKLRLHPQRIVFPEGHEPRVLQAARQFVALKLGTPVMLGDPAKIAAAAAAAQITLEGMDLMHPGQSAHYETFARRFAALRNNKGLKRQEAREAMLQPNYFGAMMLAMQQADGLVSGASAAAGAVLRPLFQIIKTAPGNVTASSCMIMEVNDSRFGDHGVLFMADCGVIPEPTVEQLADIAVSTAHLSHQLLGTTARVALLSFSSKGSARHAAASRIEAAAALAVQKAKTRKMAAEFDGELQADAALVADIAARKVPESKIAGRANVLIFPDLHSGNIAAHLVHHLAHANAYGQILLGLNRPAADVSRGFNAADIFGAAAIVGVQAIQNQSPEF